MRPIGPVPGRSHGPAGGDVAQARRHAEMAKERAWCDGPPHCYQPALDEAERLLGEMDKT